VIQLSRDKKALLEKDYSNIIIAFALIFFLTALSPLSSHIALADASYVLDSVVGEWHSAQGGECQSNDYVQEFRWGELSDLACDCPSPSRMSDQSGYLFEGTTNVSFTEGNVFKLGTFTHFNRVICAGSSPSAIDLNLTIDFSQPNHSVQTITYHFQHEETPNDTPCSYPGSTICPDKVDIEQYVIPNDTITFSQGGNVYMLEIVGFGRCGFPEQAVRQFFTDEGYENTACLYGRLRELNPAIDIVKRVEGYDADSPPGPIFDAGADEVSWTYEVTNVGDVTLTDIEVHDDNTPDDGIGDDSDFVCNISSLQPGYSTTCTNPYGPETADLGQYKNVGIVEGHYDVGGEDGSVSDTDPCHYFGKDTELIIENNLSEMEVVQKNATGNQVALRDLAGGNTVAPFLGYIDVTVDDYYGGYGTGDIDYDLGASYFSSTEDGSRETSNQLLKLTDVDSGSYHFLPYNTAVAGTDPRPGSAALVNITDDLVQQGDDFARYNLSLDFSELALDYESGDSMVFTISFWLYDIEY